MKKEKTYPISLVIIILVAIAIFAFSAAEPTNVKETVKIGYIGPLTGDVAVLGTDASKSIEVAVEKANAAGGINGKQIELFIEDDQYNTEKTVTAYNKLVNVQGVETIIVSTYGGLFAIADMAYNDGVLLVDSLDCDKDIANLPDNTFCVAKETEDLADVIANYATEKGFEKIGIMYGTVDQFMPSVAERFKKTASGIDVTLEPYTPGTTDFKTQLLKLKDNDAIVFLGYDEIGIAIRQANELGIDKPRLTIPSVATTPSIQENSKGAIDGIYFSFYAPLDDNLVANGFYEDFEEKNGRTPFVFVASDHAYDAASILIDSVLPSVNSENKQERLQQKIQAMNSVIDYPGASGTLTMKTDGRISGILIRLYQLQDLKPVYIQG